MRVPSQRIITTIVIRQNALKCYSKIPRKLEWQAWAADLPGEAETGSPPCAARKEEWPKVEGGEVEEVLRLPP